MTSLYQIKQLETKLLAVAANEQKFPKTGWLRTIRETLGLTLEQVGKRLGIGKMAVQMTEMSEQNKTIKLETLEKFADALDCQVYYYLVPKKSWSKQLEQSAEQLARKLIASSKLHMALENQTVNDQTITEEQIKLIKQELLMGKLSKLWDYGE